MNVSDIINEDGTFGPAVNEAHIRAYRRIIKENDSRQNVSRFTHVEKTKIPICPGSEHELYPDGTLKRY